MKFFKRFYNPFKPHICQLINGKYAVRKLTLIGWEYLDSTSSNGKRYNYWCIVEGSILQYCSNNLKMEAESRLNEYNKPKPKLSRKV
jgi:hypothetical protein